MSTITEMLTERDSTASRQIGTLPMRRTEDEADMTYTTRIQLSEASTAGMPNIVRAPAQYRGIRAVNETGVPKVKRRLQGFFIQAEGLEARVALVSRNGYNFG